ncbi:MAG: DNA-processing protein DprA [Flavobacteriaceae bacterium]|nr:DNA-processing protein DprA [Flavobacteriaceae bacterium]
MNDDELLYALALQRTKNIGDINAKRLISKCGSAENVFLEKKQTLTKINGIGSFAMRYLFDGNNLKEAEKELAYIKKHQITPRYFLDDLYPERLRYCIDAPLVLFSKGNINLNNPRVISIVGTRKITSYGRSFCQQLIEEIKEYNPLIVSGFAYGVDISAHQMAMKHQLQTIGVMAHGLEQIYPKAHQKYVETVLKNGGFLTEFWHNDAIQRENFLQRNRIIAGMSEATIVIESAEKGGSLVTADIAFSYDREVFAVPGRTNDTYSKGCNNLIKRNKAAILTSGKDLARYLNWDLEEKQPKSIQKQLFVEMSSEEQKIHDFLMSKGKQLLDVISLECQIPIHQTTTTLFQMEMKGVIRPLPGKLFEAI